MAREGSCVVRRMGCSWKEGGRKRELTWRSKGRETELTVLKEKGE